MGHQIKQIRTISQVEIGSDLFCTQEMIPVRSPTSATGICTGGLSQAGIAREHDSRYKFVQQAKLSFVTPWLSC